MAMEPKASYYNTVSAVASAKPCLLHKAIFRDSDNNGTLTIYDGLDAGTGRKIAVIDTLYPKHGYVDFGGVGMSRGIYVQASGTIVNYTITYELVPDNV